MKTAAKLFAAMMVASLSSYASASCTCSCVNSQIEPVCTRASDLPPVCAPRACTVKPTPASLVANKSRFEANAAKQCKDTLVLNQQTGAYILKQVCQ